MIQPKLFWNVRWLSVVAGASLTVSFCVVAKAAPRPADPSYLKEHYTKFEFNIPMRDGVHLYTTVYVPKDNDKRYPILLTRTPYSLKPYGEDVPLNPRGP